MQSKPLSMPIYMDHNATTPVDPRVHQAMLPYLSEQFGNASSASHAFGWQAQAAVKKARQQVASLLGCQPNQVVWTAGATESNNIAILGVARAFREHRPHMITQATEHKAVLEVMEAAREWNADVTVLSVNADGIISMRDLENAITPNTVLCSIMTANNEIGTLQPIREIAELCKRRQIIFHTDATQSVGKCDFDLSQLPVDMLSISAHKIYGPKGAGALIVRPTNRDFTLKPILFGGDQENKLRPGTLNVVGIVGLGEACHLLSLDRVEECERLCRFQTQILEAVSKAFPIVKLNGPRQNRLCNNLNFSLPNVHPDEVMLGLSGVAYSSGSACTSGDLKPSHVLKALGLADPLARSTLRFGIGRFTTQSEVDTLISKLLKTLDKVYEGRASASTQPL